MLLQGRTHRNGASAAALPTGARVKPCCDGSGCASDSGGSGSVVLKATSLQRSTVGAGRAAGGARSDDPSICTALVRADLWYRLCSLPSLSCLADNTEEVLRVMATLIGRKLIIMHGGMSPLIRTKYCASRIANRPLEQCAPCLVEIAHLQEDGR